MNPEQHRVSDFEAGRRQLETRNERFIHAVLGGFLLLSSLGMALVHALHLPLPAPPLAMIVSEAVGALVCGAVWLALRLLPGYAAWRKYLLTALDLAILFALAEAGMGNGNEAMSIMMPVAGSMVLVVLCALRYSTAAVLFCGVVVMLGHVLRSLRTDLDISIPILADGSILLLLVIVVVAYVVHSMIRLHRQAASRERLGRFLAPQVLQAVEAAPELTLEPVEREVTVVVADISGFTRMSSTMPPKEIVRLLNEYFPAMVDVVFDHGGTLEKYIGDALLSIWGAPVAMPDAADRAVAAAVDMLRCVERLNRGWQAEGRPSIAIHVGIHSGPVAAGNIGTADYIQYACIGDTTNVASRVCDAAEGGQVLISAATRRHLTTSDWPLVELPPAKLKGKEEAMQLFRVMATGQQG